MHSRSQPAGAAALTDRVVAPTPTATPAAFFQRRDLAALAAASCSSSSSVPR